MCLACAGSGKTHTLISRYVKLTLDKAMEYFMDMEEYEKCAEIRDLDILIQNLENEAGNIETGKSNQRKSKIN